MSLFNVRRSLVFFVTVAALALTSMVAQAKGPQDFTLVNKTGVEIHGVFVSPHSSDSWEEDILGKDTLANGESLDIKFHRSETAKMWDLKITDSKGNAITWQNFNLLEIEEITLHYDAETGKAWADVK